MKKILFTALLASCSAMILNGQVHTVIIGDGTPDGDATGSNFNARTPVASGSGYTFSAIQDGVTFTMDVQGHTDYFGSNVNQGISIFSNGAGLGVTGGTSTSPSTRVSNNTTATASDDEYLVISLSVSDASALSSLSMSDFFIRYNSTRVLTVDDGDKDNTMVSNFGNVTNLNYDDHFTALDELTLGNVADWTLVVGMADTNPADFVTALGGVSFEYTLVPEPSSYALLSGVAVLGMLAMRRRR